MGAAPDAAVHIKEENDIEIIYTTFPESDNWDIENCISKYETYLKKNNVKSKHQTDDKMDISVDEDDKDKGNKGKAGKGARTKKGKGKSSDKINDKSPLKESNFVHNNDQLIKLEDELQITDEDEEATTGSSSNSSRAICGTTPIKLKKIKHEQKTQFSEMDVVDLSDNDDGIFPYSQLFDIKLKDESVKPEIKIKQECMSSDIEKAEPLDIDNEVVILTDSDDDDNPWLQRLSRSQLMNEDKEPDTIKSVVKNEIDLGIWQDDDISKILRKETPSTSKDFNGEMTSAQSVGIDASEGTSSKEIPVEHTSIDKKIERSDSINLPTTKMDAMDGNVNLSNKPSLSENIDHATRQKTDVTQNAELHKQTEASSSKSPPSADAKHRPRFATTRRIIPMIDAPHLPPRRGGRPKSADRKRDSSKDSRKEQPKTPEEKLPSDLTTEENKMHKLRERLDDRFYNKEPRPSKVASKGSPDASSKSSKSTSISKQEKKVIIEERKARLRKIAEDEKLAADSNKSTKRGTAKPKVKISLKNRGDFLCKEQAVCASKPFSDKSAMKAKSNSDKANRTISTCGADAPGSVIHGTKTNKLLKENISKNSVNNVAASLEQALCLNNTPDTVKVSEKYNDTRNPKVTNSAEKKHDGGKRHENGEATISTGEVAASKSSGTLGECAPILRNNPSLKLAKAKEKKKRVRFSANVDINEYEIESDNTLKRLIGKDAPIPTDKLVKMENREAAVWSPKIEEFLLRIFDWKPVWLEEQRYFRSDPPVVREEELQPVRVRYDSFEHYYRVATPLMLLETWQSIIKDFEMMEQNVRNATVMCSIVQGSITHKPIPMTDQFVTTMMLETLVTIDNVMKQSYPKMGDLVSFEYVKPSNDRQMFHKVFVYITDMRLTVITDFTQFNQNLRSFVKNPHAVVTYNVEALIKHDILLHRVHRMRTIKYLRADLRMVQAVQYLPQSPLMKLILNPKVQDYQLPLMNASFTCASLVTEDKLNQKQLEAVYKVTDVVIKKEAKICLIQGPPGTGKTKVIVNLVTQILYGNREHNNRTDKIKILLCAPSNAAIDEIVVRLLAIRTQLKQRYKAFNLVRIGVPEYMHPKAKPVSPSELAKRNLKKFTEGLLHWSSNRMNDNNTTDFNREKLKLERQINNHKEMLSKPQNLTEAGKRQLKRELTDASCQYELLMSRKLFDEANPKDRVRFQRASEDRIVGHADIIACTLSSCFTNQMESIFGANRERFSVCIVDEATQSCEPESLIPLMLGVNTLVLVGDPNQLPATILSQRAKKLGWDQSIFSRVQHAFGSQTNNPTIMLDTQYRMAYSISYFPNRYFYNCKLKSATEGSQSFPFHPYRVLNHNSMQNNDRFSNTTEAEFVANIIYAMLIYAKWKDNETVSLGVLTPYNNQRTVVLNKIHDK